jgi:hypothetical protein
MSTIAHLAVDACIATILATFVCPSTIAHAADATYDYTGQALSNMSSLDGTITLAAPLAPNVSNFSVTPIYALFGFGNPSIGFRNPNTGGSLILAGPDPSYAGQAGTGLTFSTLIFSTDGTGTITGWDLVMAGTPLSYESFTATSTQSGDSTQYLIIESNDNEANRHDDGANSTPGTWTELTPSPAPEIDPGMAGSGLTLLAGVLATVRGRKHVAA